MKKPKAFKPKFNGSMIIFLHDEIPERLADRARFTQDWLKEGRFTGGKRAEIMSRKRKFQITLHILDKDGHKRGENELVFTSKGGQRDISTTIFNFGNQFCDELRAQFDDIEIDLVNSYAVVRA